MRADRTQQCTLINRGYLLAIIVLVSSYAMYVKINKLFHFFLLCHCVRFRRKNISSLHSFFPSLLYLMLCTIYTVLCLGTINYQRKMIFQSVTQAARKKKSEYSQQDLRTPNNLIFSCIQHNHCYHTC